MRKTLTYENKTNTRCYKIKTDELQKIDSDSNADMCTLVFDCPDSAKNTQREGKIIDGNMNTAMKINQDHKRLYVLSFCIQKNDVREANSA